MLKCEHTSVMNFDNAIRGIRNPMNSWDKSDSHGCYMPCGTPCDYPLSYCIGKNDLKLMKSLAKAGSDHRKFLRQIFVSVDITAPLYWWAELDTYKVGTVVNSCSTMHKIHAKEFTLDDFSHEHLFDDEDVELFGKELPLVGTALQYVVDALNLVRDDYLKTNDKKYWWQMIQLLPSSYNQKRTVTMNYENLISMYYARCNHKLDEWHDFCDWIKTLPYAEDLILVK